MNILVFCEHENGSFKKSTLELISKAASLSSNVSAVVIGEIESSSLGGYGAKTVYQASGESFNDYSSGLTVRAIQTAVSSSDANIVFASGSPQGKDTMPRLAARLRAGLASDVSDVTIVEGAVIGRRAQYAGKAFCDVKILSDLKLFTVRPNSFKVQPSTGESCEVKSLTVESTDSDLANKVISVEASVNEIADLTEADRIVSGGRSVKSKEKFDELIRPLAASINATPGASRAAVDQGYAGHSDQVGQTGKVVNPTLYIACGISGAIQHLAGMRTSRIIVAINKDKEAPIFKHATYGIVADMFDICPELTRVLSGGESVKVAQKPQVKSQEVKTKAENPVSAASTSPAPAKVEKAKALEKSTIAPQSVSSSTATVAPVVATQAAQQHAVASVEIDALKSEIQSLKEENNKLINQVLTVLKENKSALKSEMQRSEKNARSFQETGLRRYDDVERLVTSEVRKVREVLRLGIQNDTAEIQRSTSGMYKFVLVVFVVNIIAISGLIWSLFSA
jgi:electron transfer flavoprotein alpha subunit